MKNKIKKYRWALVFLSLGILCSLSYNLIGSSIDESGFLIEPFFLIPIGWFFIFFAILNILFVVIKNIYKHFKKQRQA